MYMSDTVVLEYRDRLAAKDKDIEKLKEDIEILISVKRAFAEVITNDNIELKKRRDEIEELKKKLAVAYDDCIDAVNKIKNDPITDMGSHHRLEGSFQTAKSWMIAIAEDIEREIIARKEALQK